jgi:hypothetical protein
MSTTLVALAWLGLALALGAVVQVAFLLNRVLRPLREIKRYADEILVSGLAIARNLDDVDEAARTAELVDALPGAAAPVVERLGAQ